MMGRNAPPFALNFARTAALAAAFLAGPASAQVFQHGAQHQPGGPAPVFQGAGQPTSAVPLGKRDANDLRARYRVLDNVEAPHVNLNLPAVRPIVSTRDGQHVYALNVHDSTVFHLDAESLPGTLLERSFRTPWGPVAAAVHTTPLGDEELLISCRGHHVLSIHDPVTGEILDVVELEFEPADILVFDDAQKAYIACSGADSVVEVDLALREVTRSFSIPSKHPMFLSERDGKVLVTPMLSGNNSTVFPIGFEAFVILDLVTSEFINSGLPDEDVFAIDPGDGTVEAVGVEFGTVLFGHGTNPATGALWLLNTEHINKDPARQTEPSVNGAFAVNRLTIAPSLPAGPAGLDIRDLDDSDLATPGVQIDVTRTIGQPWSLDFASTGHALVTGMATDNVAILAPNGNFILDLDLPAGSIPRGAVWDSTETLALVHAWGSNQLIVFSIVPFNPNPIITFDLGFDPTPAIEKEGRAVAYSASNSQNNNLSCFTCHVDGGHDGLVWNLSAPPEDEKGPMVTQTLRGIDKLLPYHWRGERPELVDFNGAFAGLLGGVELATGPGSEFEKFERFVFSIQNTANRDAHPNRVVSSTTMVDADNGRVANAVNGQRIFFDGVNGSASLCEVCHAAPAGTNGELQNTSAADINGHKNFMKVTPFTEVWRKEMPLATFEFFNGAQRSVPVIGSGLTHGGVISNLFQFVDFFPIDAQQTADVWSFVSQWDSGLAPAIHKAAFISQSTVAERGALLDNYLVPQARRRNADVALLGVFDVGGVDRDLAWVYVPGLDRFVAEDSTIDPQPPAFFIEQAEAGLASFTAMGLPVGSGERFAIDHDQDRLFNLDEVVAGTDVYLSDSDGDLFPDGIEVSNGSDPLDENSLPVDNDAPQISHLRVQWATMRAARVSFETSEPTSFALDYSTPLGSPSSVVVESLAVVHNVLLRDLLPSTAGQLIHVYSGLLTVTDAAGNESQAQLPEFNTRSLVQIVGPVFPSKIGEFQWIALGTADGGSSLGASVELRVDKVLGGPPALAHENQVVVARVLVNGQLSTNWSTTGPTAFKRNGVDYSSIFNSHPGPFLISDVSAVDGRVRFAFNQPDLVAGDVVTVNIEYVVTVDGSYDPLDPDFGFADNPFPLGWWNLGETPKELRKLETTF